MLKKNVKAEKGVEEWVAAIYCDYGNPEIKKIIRRSYSLETAKRTWEKFKKFTNRGAWRCWQETKAGKILNDTGNKHEKVSTH